MSMTRATLATGLGTLLWIAACTPATDGSTPTPPTEVSSGGGRALAESLTGGDSSEETSCAQNASGGEDCILAFEDGTSCTFGVDGADILLYLYCEFPFGELACDAEEAGLVCRQVEDGEEICADVISPEGLVIERGCDCCGFTEDDVACLCFSIDEPIEEICYDREDPAVEELNPEGEPDWCLLADFDCAGGWAPFWDDCGCGCRDTADPACPDREDPDVEYINPEGQPEWCLAALFDCTEEGWEPFSNECGCGCVNRGS